jgi:hypothetical protein
MVWPLGSRTCSCGDREVDSRRSDVYESGVLNRLFGATAAIDRIQD